MWKPYFPKSAAWDGKGMKGPSQRGCGRIRCPRTAAAHVGHTSRVFASVKIGSHGYNPEGRDRWTDEGAHGVTKEISGWNNGRKDSRIHHSGGALHEVPCGICLRGKGSRRPYIFHRNIDVYCGRNQKMDGRMLICILTLRTAWRSTNSYPRSSWLATFSP